MSALVALALFEPINEAHIADLAGYVGGIASKLLRYVRVRPFPLKFSFPNASKRIEISHPAMGTVEPHG
jgi:hypothetical protein